MVKAFIFQEVERFFEEFVPKSPKGIRLCAAVSGGCDSTALFRALFALRDKLGIARLGIAHVNHKLRGAESDEDAAFVKNLSVMHRVDFHEKALTLRPGASGMEERARGERYGFFNELRAAEGYDYVATGHTADDQAETVLMRIMRGSGLRGLCAIAPVRQDGIIRPLLNVKRASLEAWFKELDAVYREDSSNRNIAYHRNLVRLKLLPALTSSAGFDGIFLTRIAQAAYRAWKPLSIALNNWNDLNVVSHDHDRFEIKKRGFMDYAFADEAVAEVLRKKAIRFEQCHIHEMVSNAHRGTGVFLLPGGWRYRFGRDTIDFFRPDVGSVCAAKLSTSPAGTPDSLRFAEFKQGTLFTGEGRGGGAAQTGGYDLKTGAVVACGNVTIGVEIERVRQKEGERHCFSEDNMTVFLDADCIHGPVEFRAAKPDDVFQPLGCGEKRNLRDYLKKRKKDYRKRGIVAEKTGNVLWVPGVQIGDQCKVTHQTTTLLKFSCKPLE